MKELNVGDMIYNKQLKENNEDTEYCYYVYSIDSPRIYEDKQSVLLQSLFGDMDVIHIMLDYVLSVNTPEERYEKISEEDDLYKKCEEFLKKNKNELAIRHLDLYDEDTDENDKWEIRIKNQILNYDIVDDTMVVITKPANKTDMTLDGSLGISVKIPEGHTCFYTIEKIDVYGSSTIYNRVLYTSADKIQNPVGVFSHDDKYVITFILIKRSSKIPIILTGDNNND